MAVLANGAAPARKRASPLPIKVWRREKGNSLPELIFLDMAWLWKLPEWPQLIDWMIDWAPLSLFSSATYCYRNQRRRKIPKRKPELRFRNAADWFHSGDDVLSINSIRNSIEMQPGKQSPNTAPVRWGREGTETEGPTILPTIGDLSSFWWAPASYASIVFLAKYIKY
jgi:hypothetical protein